MQYKLEGKEISRFSLPEGFPQSDYLKNRKSLRGSSEQALKRESTRAEMEAEIEKQRQLLKDKPKRLQRLERVVARIRATLQQSKSETGEQ